MSNELMAIEAVNVWLEKGNVQILKNINIKIKHGSFTVIRGRSGSGKTSLLSVLSTLDRPTSGRVIVDGNDVTSATFNESTLPLFRRSKIGFVFQEFNLIDSLTVMENIIAPALATGRKKKEIEERALELMRAVGLSERRDFYPPQLSGGEKQRTALARALINDPIIVFADEPTANLDTATAKEVLDLMRKLNKEHKKTFVVATHDEMLINYADEIYDISDGTLKKASK
ncbi:MAG: ABC transporter ATP-binding protein [Candidatus Korarchaeota archaeon]